jgi:redox-sensitive bicupin YhaK (pirin superfamily)
MEIITYVRSGAITHRDSMGNEGRTEAGDVQVMSAGSGVTHSEMNKEDIDTTLYQIWIEAQEQNVTPRWDCRAFPKTDSNNALTLLVSGQPEHKSRNALFIHQDAAIYGGRIQAGQSIKQAIKHQAYVLASQGAFTIVTTDGSQQILKQGDGAEIIGSLEFLIKADLESEIIVIDVPQQ